MTDASPDEPVYPQPCGRWPTPDTPGTYRIGCSCGQWESTGTAAQIRRASLSHDDAPWQSHVVTIRERLS